MSKPTRGTTAPSSGTVSETKPTGAGTGSATQMAREPVTQPEAKDQQKFDEPQVNETALKQWNDKIYQHNPTITDPASERRCTVTGINADAKDVRVVYFDTTESGLLPFTPAITLQLSTIFGTEQPPAIFDGRGGFGQRLGE